MYDYEGPVITTLSRTRLVKARKHHTCCFCLQPIMAGVKYYRSVYLVDGEFTFDKSHTPNGECADGEK